MLKRFLSEGPGFPFSAINPSIIGQQVIVRSRFGKDSDLSSLIAVATYQLAEDPDGQLFYYFNGDDQLMFSENDEFVPFQEASTGFNEYSDCFTDVIKVGNVGVDLVGNNVTFPNYRNKHGLAQRMPITGKVIGVSRNSDEYLIRLGAEDPEEMLLIRVHAHDEVVL